MVSLEHPWHHQYEASEGLFTNGSIAKSISNTEWNGIYEGKQSTPERRMAKSRDGISRGGGGNEKRLEILYKFGF